MRISTALWPTIGCLVLGSQAAAQTTQTYFYDVHGRVVAGAVAPSTGGMVRRYGFDAADNRTLRETGAIVPHSSGDVLAPGEQMTISQKLVSADNRFVFVLQIDGNAVIYGPSGPLGFHTNTAGGTALFLTMQTNGDLVLRDYDLDTIWSPSTGGHPGARLVMQNDGDLVIYDGATAIWSSGTGGH